MYLNTTDDSTCCDEDFTWVRSDKETKQKNPSVTITQTEQITPQSQPSSNNSHNNNNSNNNNNGKPPRPSGSLDRRRTNVHHNRQERDSKSRSAHSLKDRMLTSEFKDAPPNHKGIYTNIRSLVHI